jgi:transcriptional antiterminator
VQWVEKHDLRIKEKPSFVKPVRKPLRIIVEDLNTGLVSELESAENLADKLGVSKNTFQSHISRHNGIWKQRLKVTYKGPVE